MHIFDDEFLNSLPVEPILALRELLSRLISAYNQSLGSALKHPDLVNAHAFVCEFSRQSPVPGLPPLSIEADIKSDEFQIFSDRVFQLAKEFNSAKAIESNSSRVADFLARRRGATVSYEFSDEDYGNLQEQISKLRSAIATHPDLSEGHRTRMFARIEAIQQELHRKVSNVDRYLGLILDASVTLKKLAKNGAEIAVALNIISNIVFAAVLKAEGLDYANLLGMSAVYMLGNSQGTDEDEKKKVDGLQP